MHWNEKIDLIKKNHSHEEFSVPHVDRKDVLRKIETKLIGRSKDYYDLNNFNERFCNWWDDIKTTTQATIDRNSDFKIFLDSLIDPTESFWIAGEFPDGIMIYKARKSAILSLFSIGLIQTNSFHLIQLKYDYLVSFRIENAKISMKANGNERLDQKIKLALALCHKS